MAGLRPDRRVAAAVAVAADFRLGRRAVVGLRLLVAEVGEVVAPPLHPRAEVAGVVAVRRPRQLAAVVGAVVVRRLARRASVVGEQRYPDLPDADLPDAGRSDRRGCRAG